MRCPFYSHAMLFAVGSLSCSNMSSSFRISHLVKILAPRLPTLVHTLTPCHHSVYSTLSLPYVRSCISFRPIATSNLLNRVSISASKSMYRFSTASEENPEEVLKKKKSNLVQRFRESYAVYGKVVIVVHGLTSCMWFAGVYGLACSGINLLDFFESAKFPEWLCRPLRIGGGVVNTWATALVLYKLIAPLRYTVTIILTRYAVRYLRITGKAPPVVEQNRLRNLARESAQLSRERLKARISKGKTKALTISKNARRSIMERYRR